MNCANRRELVGPLLFVYAGMLILISNKRILDFSFLSGPRHMVGVSRGKKTIMDFMESKQIGKS